MEDVFIYRILLQKNFPAEKSCKFLPLSGYLGVSMWVLLYLLHWSEAHWADRPLVFEVQNVNIWQIFCFGYYGISMHVVKLCIFHNAYWIHFIFIHLILQKMCGVLSFFLFFLNFKISIFANFFYLGYFHFRRLLYFNSATTALIYIIKSSFL